MWTKYDRVLSGRNTMDFSALCHLVKFVRKNDKSKEVWLVAPTLMFSSLVIVEEQLCKEYVSYYLSFEEDFCIDRLFEDQ
jgi:hypothetical protein